MHEDELNFLKEELKKIDDRIKVVQYGGSKEVVEFQIKLWELREKIMKEIDKFVDIYVTRYNAEERKIDERKIEERKIEEEEI